MPRIVYCGPYDEVYVPAHHLAGIRRGVPIEVSESVAEDLLRQPDNWQPAHRPAKSVTSAGKE